MWPKGAWKTVEEPRLCTLPYFHPTSVWRALRLPDTVRVSTNRSYIPLGVCVYSTNICRARTRAQGTRYHPGLRTLLLPEIRVGDTGCVSHRGTDTAVGEGEFQHRRNYAQRTTKQEYSPVTFPKRGGCGPWQEQCVSKDGEETEDTVETRVGVPTSLLRVDSCVYCFSAKRHNTTMFTHSQDAMKMWSSQHLVVIPPSAPCRKALKRLTSLALGRITQNSPKPIYAFISCEDNGWDPSDEEAEVAELLSSGSTQTPHW